MAIHVKCSTKVLESSNHSQPTIHYMPCSIKFDGPANVSKYFKPIPTDKDSSYKKASFRGKPLNGQDISFPTGWKGLVIQETKQPLVDNVERTLHVSNMFDRLTYWNWDKVPSANDPFVNALGWIDIAEALHASDETSQD